MGTTVCRALEAYAITHKAQGWTNLFIRPGFNFQLVGALVTNFHLPRSTLYVLVCAFAGVDLMRLVYSEAISKKYRFYSYGDAMVIL